jgi:hypothetical protein
MSMAFVKDAKGISFKNILKGHINWRKVTHVKVCTQMGNGQPSVCTTSDFHAVLFWFVYDTSAFRRPTLTIGVYLERKITWLSTGENIFWKY